jgi:hypothetical protein
MLTIKFDDATIKLAIGAFCGKMAGSGFDRLADVFAAEANRQLAEHVAKCSAMTDENLAQELRKAWYHSGKEGWLEFGCRAREILAFAQPTAPVFEAGKSYLNKRGEIVPLEDLNPPYGFYHFRGGDYVYGADGRIDRGSDSEFDLIPGAIDDEPAVDWKARAEKAEARMECLRNDGKILLSGKETNDYGKGVQEGYRMALLASGFRVIPAVPAQPLRVEVCDE